MENKIKQLEQYQTFTTAAQMLHNVESFVKSNHITKSALKVLRLIAWQAKNFPGACWLKVKTICEKVGVSDATVRRSTRLLEKLGIIKKISTTRELSGGDGANIYQILPFSSSDSGDDSPQLIDRQDGETPEETASEQQKNEPKYVPHKCDTKNNINIRNKGPNFKMNFFDHTFVSDHVPGEFIQGIKKYFDDADVIEDLWDRVLKAINLYSADVLAEEIINEAVHAVKVTGRKWQQRKIKTGNTYNDFLGYFFGVMSTKVVVIQRKITSKSQTLEYYRLNQG